MKQSNFIKYFLAGVAAGAVNGFFGAGGGMLLIPLLTYFCGLRGTSLFSTSIAVMLPICMVTLICTWMYGSLDAAAALPYLIGSAIGGGLAGRYGARIPALWLHRGLGIMILWGGIRYLC